MASKVNPQLIIDTNLLCRYFVKSDPKLNQEAKNIIDGQTPYLVPESVVCELSFMLLSNKLTKEQVCQAYQILLQLPSCQMYAESRIAIQYYFDYNLHIVDCFVLAHCKVNNHIPLATQDKKLQKIAKITIRK